MVFYYIENNGQKTKLPDTVIMIHGLGTSTGEIRNTDGTTTRPEKLNFLLGQKSNGSKANLIKSLRPTALRPILSK
jgi:hypothetical protein